MRTRALLITVLFVGAMAACGGDDGDTDEATDQTTAAEDEGSAGGGGDADVVAEDIAFDPTTIEVSAGDAVTWENLDSVGHTVTAGTPDEPGSEFDEDLPAGETVEVTFDEAGTHPYFCEIHPNMTGEVVVS